MKSRTKERAERGERNGAGRVGPERALIVKATLAGTEVAEDPLEEITALAETAGAHVVGAVTQRLQRPHPATYLGRGKVEEIGARAAEVDADIIITDSDLSPAQERNLERITSRMVVDRSELIMDIFSQRARTAQARLQVELAQLRYSLPRLKRLWTHLSRYEGGIGMRGPGETQLEEDKRIIRRRIQKLKSQLERLEGHKEAALRRRRNEFVIALVGYTNAGKSTLLNRLTDSSELVEDKLFATLDTRVRRWLLGDHRYVLLTDTVGFIRDLPHHLVASFHATLAETQYADVLFHLVDASSSAALQQMRTVREVLGQLNCHDKETWVLFNKWDRVAEDRVIEARSLSSQLRGNERAFLVSARAGAGLDELKAAVIERFERDEKAVELLVPHTRGDVIAFVRENGRVLANEYRAEGVHLAAALSPARLAKLRSLFPQGFPPAADPDF
jgi:GTP-binding protein HflX